MKTNLGNNFSIERVEHCDGADTYSLYEGDELIDEGCCPVGVLSLAKSEGADPGIVGEVAKEICCTEDAALFS